MPSKPNYEIYCLYHNKVFSKYYGNQIDQVTFVKMDRGPYVFKSKKHIHLVKQPWFEPIGKEWAEYEFYYSLYKGYKNGLIELPEYMGFIQYDMEFKGKEEKYKKTSIIDFIEELIDKGELNEKTLISFQPYDFKIIYDQNFIMDPKRPDVRKDYLYENCLDTIIKQVNNFTNQNKTIDNFKDKKINMCGSVFIHRNVFMDIMRFLSNIIEDDRLSIFNKKNRYQGDFLERYFAVYIEYINIYNIIFLINHKFISSKENIFYKNLGKIGIYLKSKTPFIYKTLKPYFPNR